MLATAAFQKGLCFKAIVALKALKTSIARDQHQKRKEDLWTVGSLLSGRIYSRTDSPSHEEGLGPEPRQQLRQATVPHPALLPLWQLYSVAAQ